MANDVVRFCSVNGHLHLGYELVLLANHGHAVADVHCR